MIIRAPRPDSGYLIVRNDVLRDGRVSIRARGLLAIILSRPDNWTTDATKLAAENPEGREAILTAMAELREVGYMRQERIRDPKTGQISTVTYVFDYPESGIPESENPFPVPTRGNSVSPLVAPKTGLPESVNPTPIEDCSKKTEDSNEDNVHPIRAKKPGPQADETFDHWYATYPKHVAPGAARKSYRAALKLTDAATLLAGAERMAAEYPDRSPKGLKYCAMPSTWLNQERWLDETPTVSKADEAWAEEW